RRSLERRREAALQKQEDRRLEREAQPEPAREPRIEVEQVASTTFAAPPPALRTRRQPAPPPVSETLPWEDPPLPEATADIPAAEAAIPASPDEIPICQLADTPAPAGELAEFPFSKPARQEPK